MDSKGGYLNRQRYEAQAIAANVSFGESYPAIHPLVGKPRSNFPPWLGLLLCEQPMPSCKQCNQPMVEIDHYGERLTGCPTCNSWQASTGEWCRLAPDDIVALRSLKATKTETSSG